jgi:hypothetical protein
MAITWHGNTEVKTAQGVPETSHGPALASLGNTLYSMYVGQGEKNLWMTSVSSGTFPTWTTNQQIKIAANNIPLSSFRPAVAVLNGIIHMVYVGQGGANLWWSWFDGKNWAGNLQLPYSGSNPQPALAAFNGKLHLVWHNFIPAVTQKQPNGQVVVVQPAHEYIFHDTYDAREPLQVSSWQTQPTLGDGAQLPALAAFNGSLYIILSQAIPDGTGVTKLYKAKWDGENWPGWKVFTITGSSPASAGGAAMDVFNKALYIVYPGQNGANLWYAYIDTLDVAAGNIQIKTGNTTPKTSAPIGVAAFNGSLCVAYKGESSNNFWFAYATP